MPLLCFFIQLEDRGDAICFYAFLMLHICVHRLAKHAIQYVFIIYSQTPLFEKEGLLLTHAYRFVKN